MVILISIYFVTKINIPAATESKKNGPDFVFNGVKISHYDDGELVMKLNSKSTEVSKNNQTFKLKKMIAKYFHKDKLTMIFASPDAQVSSDYSLFVLKNADAVFLDHGETVVIKAEQITFDHSVDKFKAIGNVEVWRNNVKITTNELLFLTKDMKIDLLKNPVVFRYIDS